MKRDRSRWKTCPNEYEVIPQRGGFAVVRDEGALLFDNSRTESLQLEPLTEAFKRVCDLLLTTRKIEESLDGIVKERGKPGKQRPAAALLGDLNDLRGKLVDANHRYHAGIGVGKDCRPPRPPNRAGG
ncbi:MAG: hypothetical protein ACRERU_17420, partial [Methylococcales bacterium]